MSTGRLLTPSFCCIAAANFLLFFGFYAIMPLLPFYLDEAFSVERSVAGVILASYSVACIVVRPIAGWLLDTFRRRPIYVAAYAVFAVVFCGYAVASFLFSFIVLRILHGAAFGLTTVAGNTVVVGLVPPSRIGEGLGYYGLGNTLAMCLGPMAGLAAYETFSFGQIFIGAFAAAALGLIMAVSVRVPAAGSAARRSFSLNNMFLRDGAVAAAALFLASVPYGATTAYIAVYAGEITVEGNAGLYFTFMAVGLGAARLLSGRWVDRGRIDLLILGGLSLVAVSYAVLASLGALSAPATVFCLYLAVALSQGLAYGTLHPAFNTLFVRMAPESRRGAATSTYLTAWDTGIGVGILAGGALAQLCGGFASAYLAGAVLSAVSVLVFIVHRRSAPACRNL